MFLSYFRYVAPSNSIDLLNVAFSKETDAGNVKYGEKFDTPDRVTGKMGYEALKCLFPDRKWNFVEVNICYFNVIYFVFK